MADARMRFEQFERLRRVVEGSRSRRGRGQHVELRHR